MVDTVYQRIDEHGYAVIAGVLCHPGAGLVPAVIQAHPARLLQRPGSYSADWQGPAHSDCSPDRGPLTC